MPQPYSPAAGSVRPALAHTFARNEWGICSITPAPSPVFASLPAAPRWSRFFKISKPCSKIRCDLRPFMSTTKPRPQASCSNQGS